MGCLSHLQSIANNDPSMTITPKSVIREGNSAIKIHIKQFRPVALYVNCV